MRIARGTRIAAALIALIVVLSLAAARHAPAPAETAQQGVTVYSSMPLQGASRPQSLAVVQGARLALEEAGGMAGPHRVRHISLDNATARAGTWTPENTATNTRRAAQDESAIAYIGEFNSGASTISIPILNEVPIAQISPSNTAIGLTRGGPGADLGEPTKYYPTGRRHYFRLLPNDRIQAGAVAVAMRNRRCRRVAILNDGEVYGAGMGVLVRRNARRLGLRVAHTSRIRVRARRHRGLARRVRRSGARCVAYTGITANGAVRLFRDLVRAMPRAKLFGTDGIAESGFTDPREGGVPGRVGRRVVMTVATLSPDAMPEAGRAMLQRYSARYGEPFPDPYAVQGYEAMRLVLDAVAAVGPRRRAVIRWLHGVRNRPSVVGTYSFDRFGDTTLRSYGLYRIRGGELQWAGAVRAPYRGGSTSDLALAALSRAARARASSVAERWCARFTSTSPAAATAAASAITTPVTASPRTLGLLPAATAAPSSATSAPRSAIPKGVRLASSSASSSRAERVGSSRDSRIPSSTGA